MFRSWLNPSRGFRWGLIVVASICCAVLAEPSAAQSFWGPSSMFVQVGRTDETDALSAGLSWDWNERWMLGPGLLTAYVETWISNWRYDVGGGNRRNLTQVGLTPALRWRLDDGASPWFFDAGVGLTFSSVIYQTEGKAFSTRFNFGTHLGVGRNFGARREHELMLRVEHFSNAGIKEPNPGANFVQLRYAYRFE